MATDTKFEGWLGKDKESVKGKMEWGQFEPKKWTEDDVDIEISHCGMSTPTFNLTSTNKSLGICGSDLHMLSSGWGPTPYRMLPKVFIFSQFHHTDFY
jgi:D-arabinose 1-dehydrogenase-like Zn-dependent alcohol dehydrogenase